MSEIKELIKAVNEIIKTCRSYGGTCHGCPYYDKEKRHCIIQMETEAENVPEMW